MLCMLQVSELESVFQLLRCEVERLFLQAPSVDLDALGLALNEAEGMIDEQGSIVQVRPAALCVQPGVKAPLCRSVLGWWRAGGWSNSGMLTGLVAVSNSDAPCLLFCCGNWLLYGS
jgi:hypothetical protein